MAKEMHEFQAETKQLLDLMVHSIYTNREIFLRELISNASDAIDKAHFESLTNRELLEGNETFEIYLAPDAQSHTLTIADNGIGMNREELIENIGTIAKSGTKAFMEKLKEAKESGVSDKEMIGQFGVGFYSAFMIAEKVTILTRKAGETQGYKWESAADGSYTIDVCDKDSRGTTIILQLKPEFYGEKAEEDFTSNYRLENLVKKYSDYVRYPIKMNFVIEEAPKDEEGKVIEGAEKIKRDEIRTLNSMQPLWTKNKQDIKPEEYNEFFKNLFHEWEDPMDVLHTKAEGTVEYTSLLFIPSKAPFNLYHTDYEPGLQLYSRHAFQAAETILRNILPQVNFSGGAHLRTVRIPVCYGGELGPDLGEVAAFHRLSPQQVIDIHTGGEYLVYMIGFAPGFPYVGGMSNKIATPRRKMPRLAIPAGSVGIAGEQTGVYPLETPGGWQLIGRTPLSLFNPQAKSAPSLLQAGDRIEFYAISRQEYESYGK